MCAIWGAFWLLGLQTATLWSPLVSLWWTSTGSQHCNIFIFSQCLLTGRSCLLFTPCNFPTTTPLASLSRIQHGSAEASATQTIHPCTETACISSFFPDTTQGSFGKMLMISRHKAPCQQSGGIQSIYCFRETFKDFFSALISAIARVLNLDLLTLQCLCRSNGHIGSTNQIAD